MSLPPSNFHPRDEEELALTQAKQMLNGENKKLTNDEIGAAIRTKMPEGKVEWGKIMGLALAKTMVYLENQLPNMNGRDLAYATGILADKYLDMTEGRKGVVNVDASQHLSIMKDLPIEALLKLAGESVEGSPPLLAGELYEGEGVTGQNLNHDIREAVRVLSDDSLIIGDSDHSPPDGSECVTVTPSPSANSDELWIG